VTRTDESVITYDERSAISNDLHPVRQTGQPPAPPAAEGAEDEEGPELPDEPGSPAPSGAPKEG
jgi:hypothetical protein